MFALTPQQAGQRIGGLSGRDVLLLIRQKKLRAKKLVVRGKGRKPRYLILDWAVDAYLESMEDAQADAPNAGKPAKRRRRRGLLPDVHEFV